MKEILFTSIGLIMIMFGAYELFHSWKTLEEINESMTSMQMMSTMFGMDTKQLNQYFDPTEIKQQMYHNLFIYSCVFVGGITFLLLPRLEKENNQNAIPKIKIGEDLNKD